jgi:hypothetical protein
MSFKYLKRLEIGYPTQANPRYVYAVKMIEADDTDLLQAAVNTFLYNLPDLTNEWSPHLIDTQLLTYGTGVNTVFVMKITLYISGTTLTDPPIT